MLGWLIRWFHSLFRRSRSPRGDPLDHVLLKWTPRDRFTVRDLLSGGVLILGRTGSGKTRSSGYLLALSIARYQLSGGLIISAQPHDAAMWRGIFKAAGREDCLLEFSPSHGLRFNFLEYARRLGSETRNIVQCLLILGETLQSSGDGNAAQEQFWKQAQERMLCFAVEIMKWASPDRLSAYDLQRFISGAANSPEELNDPRWAAGYHRQCLEAAFNATKTEEEQLDFQLAADYWLGAYVVLADRTKSSIVTGVMGTLHAMVTGVARRLISGETNITLDDMFRGKFILLNMSPAEFGSVGSFIGAGFKYLTQRAVLKRAPQAGDHVHVIWSDESPQTVNSFDATYLCLCRQHLGAMVFLGQGVSGFYAALKGESGEHQANSLLNNFGHTIVHAADPLTAEFCSKKLGRRLETFFGGNSSAGRDIYDELFGESRSSGSFNSQYEAVVQEGAFINGLRTGGPQNGNICDAYVIKSGEPFSNGENYLFQSFPQG